MYFLANAKTYDKQFEIAGTYAYSSNLLVGKKKKREGRKKYNLFDNHKQVQY